MYFYCATAIEFENKITHFTHGKKRNPNNKTNYFQIESYAFAKSIFQESDNTQLNFRY